MATLKNETFAGDCPRNESNVLIKANFEGRELRPLSRFEIFKETRDSLGANQRVESCLFTLQICFFCVRMSFYGKMLYNSVVLNVVFVTFQ